MPKTAPRRKYTFLPGLACLFGGDNTIEEIEVVPKSGGASFMVPRSVPPPTIVRFTLDNEVVYATLTDGKLTSVVEGREALVDAFRTSDESPRAPRA